MSALAPTPGQTIGPFFHVALPFDHDRELVPVGSAGSVRLHGFVRDGHGQGVQDAMLEIRQADPAGRVPQVQGSMRRDGAFTGWGRSHTDVRGHYWFATVEPGPVGGSARFVAVAVFARGLLDRLFTRIYLPGQEEGLAGDALLVSLPPQDRERMIAVREQDGGLRFDIDLQGQAQTPFLSFPQHRT
jgi:protocatechuate 3,4-dioxygenase alpha subunit